MNKSRLEQLLKFYAEDPNDPFTIYAMANEYKVFDHDKALFFFEILIRDHPNYIATYYHLGYLYLEMGDEEKAKSTFEKGMKIAAANNEELALRELKNAYDEFMMDY